MKIIAVVSRKGGVGKTATAHALGAGLIKRGKKVLYVDLDSQTNLSYAVGAAPGGANALDLLTGACNIIESIQHTKQGDIIRGCEQLAGADILLTDTGKEYRLKEALTPIKGRYDYIIIDTPAALGTLTVNALTAADLAIIPVQAEIFSLQGIGLLKETIDSVKKYCNKSLKVKGILVTRYKSRATLSQDMLENLEKAAKELKTKVFNTPVRECISIAEAQAMKQDIFTYAPRSNGAKDYDAFIEEFLEGAKKA